MTIKAALISSMLAIALIATAILGTLGSISISKNVIHEAQERVNHDLNTSSILYEQIVQVYADRFSHRTDTIASKKLYEKENIENLKEELEFDLLNICDVYGKPLIGDYSNYDVQVPINRDPIIRKALEGKVAWGTLLLDENRIVSEGGAALSKAMEIFTPDGKEQITKSALFIWIACPIKNTDGHTDKIIYGGKPLNYNNQLVDRLRSLVFGEELYRGKPLGTVTIFLDGIRVATNVIGPDGSRAIGTRVSPMVEKKVLQQGGQYNDRAKVVDMWYLSAYKPLKDPEGQTIGMLYTGLLEAPYTYMKIKLLIRFLIPVIIIGILAVLSAIFIVNKIIKPLDQLSEEVNKISKGQWEGQIKIPRSYKEIRALVKVFTEMRAAITERDFRLREQNENLIKTNKELEQANRNYMQMLGFVTHELKSPLAAMQTMSSVMLEGLAGEVPENVKHFLIRIKKNAEELQDMVKNYLDLSRTEQGEFVADKKEIDFRGEVIDACIAQTKELFDSRSINLKVNCPEKLMVFADPELMRIAICNYLSNAAKYGKEGGRAELNVSEEDGKIRISVWNEGDGFTQEEGKRLFSKFTRLRNKATQNNRGSGLGLYLCKLVMDQHEGHVWADSQPGEWACFNLSFPKQ